MAYNYYNNSYAQSMSLAQQQSIFNRVFLWMALGLCVTGIIAMITATTSLSLLVYGNPISFLVLILAELGLVWYLSARIYRLSASTATTLFLVYSALNGLTLSFVFLVYTTASIASTFFITGVTFGAMCLYGYTTKRDLTSIGSIALMALIGLILASLVNIFLHSSALYWLITYAGILIFVALTAYDTQRIKRNLAMVNGEANIQRFAILGALNLYLDFINLFLYLLRIFGRRR